MIPYRKKVLGKSVSWPYTIVDKPVYGKVRTEQDKRKAREHA